MRLAGGGARVASAGERLVSVCDGADGARDAVKFKQASWTQKKPLGTSRSTSTMLFSYILPTYGIRIKSAMRHLKHCFASECFPSKCLFEIKVGLHKGSPQLPLRNSFANLLPSHKGHLFL